MTKRLVALNDIVLIKVDKIIQKKTESGIITNDVKDNMALNRTINIGTVVSMGPLADAGIGDYVGIGDVVHFLEHQVRLVRDKDEELYHQFRAIRAQDIYLKEEEIENGN